MDLGEKIFLVIIVLGVLTFYLYANKTLAAPDSFWVYLLFVPLLIVLLVYMYFTINEKSITNSGGSLNFINYYGINPVYLQIIEDNKFYVYDDFVDEDSITQYEWAGVHDIQIIASDDPNIGNPTTTIYLDKTYSVTGNNTILAILNADGTIFEQLNTLC